MANTPSPVPPPLPRWAQRSFYWSATRLMAIVVRVFGRWQVRGREHVPPSGPLLVVSNHLHNADPPLLAASIPSRRIHFMTKTELFQKGVLSLPIRLFGGFPVRRDEADLRALRLAQELLSSGEAIGVLPEGHRNRHGMQAAHPGAALIAMRSGATILPVGITGTEQIRSIGILLKQPKITVTIGEPFTLTHDGRLNGAAIRRGSDEMMRRIAALLPSKYQGVWATPADAATRATDKPEIQPSDGRGSPELG